MKQKSQVARNIRAGMAYIGLKQKDMAKACGVTERTWHRWMADPESLTLGYLAIIAAKVGVKPSELLEDGRG